MKVLVCLMVTVAACNAGLLGGLGGSSVTEVQVQPQHLQHVQQVQHVEHVQHVQHVAPAPQQQVKIIKIQSIGGGGYGGGYSGASSGGYSYGASHSGGYSGVSYAQPQIIKVIHEQAPVSHGYAVQGYSNGHSQSYAPAHSTYQTSLESILPQILKIIYEDSGSSGYQGSAYAGPLIDVYGTSGRAIISKGGNSNDYLRSGHVVEKGHLEVVKVNRQQGGGSSSSGGGLGGGLAGLFRGKW